MQPLSDSPFARKLENLLVKLCNTYGISPAPKLKWSKRMKKTLGLAYVPQNTIKLSSWLNQEQAQSTLRHELAHIATGKTRNHRPHGATWKQWAALLGAPLARSSAHGPANVPNQNVFPSLWGLECPNCGLRLARHRVTKGLFHRACGPKAGHLIRTLKDSSDRVDVWVSEAIFKTETLDLTKLSESQSKTIKNK